MAKAYKKQSLGRGLSALLENQENDINSAQDLNADKLIGNVIEIPIDQIKINPFQPRTNFENDKISQLASSIEQLGIIQPITVRKIDFKSYQIISGERRFRAVSFLKIKSIPAYIRIANDQQSLEMALVENIQRENLDPIEIALCYQRLIDEIMLTQDEMSIRVGKKRSTISNYLRLLKLDPIIQTGIRDGFISMGHGRALASIQVKDKQLKYYKKILSDSLSVRQTEKLISVNDLLVKENKKVISSDFYKNDIDSLTKKLKVGVKVSLKTKNKGSISISFNNIEEYKNIIEKLSSDK
ncbi:MAG: ParB/RepB/Spo0J family partition protein [Flavobacteriaceae bacterium]|jgi:ParB family chromosome partitioning protein|nr:ParB/RepB/Spo0J family partition protein [Flavobacteriaceae bacterium]